MGIVLSNVASAAPIQNDSASKSVSEKKDASLLPIEERGTHVELHTLSAVAGIYGAEVRFAVSKAATLGFSAAIIDARFIGDEDSGYQVGLESSFALNGSRFADGWTFRPFLGYLSYDVTDSFLRPTNDPYRGEFSGLYTGASMIYQWIYPSGISIALGAGVTVYSIKRHQILTSDSGDMRSSIPFAGVNPLVAGNIGFVF